MNPQIAQAQPQVNQLYNPAVKNIQQQIPAVQQLYASLLQGLQGQVQNQQGLIDQSAAQRGVGSVGISEGAQNAFQGTMALQGAQLGAQEAGTVGDIRGQVGQANVGRGNAVYGLADQLQAQSLEKQSNKLTKTQMDREYSLKQQANQRDYSVRQVQYQKAQAEAAARAAQSAAKAAKGMELKEFLSNADASFDRMIGGDGKVSPETWGKALNLWREKGLPDTEFINRYKGYVNRSHVQDYMNVFKG